MSDQASLTELSVKVFSPLVSRRLFADKGDCTREGQRQVLGQIPDAQDAGQFGRVGPCVRSRGILEDYFRYLSVKQGGVNRRYCPASLAVQDYFPGMRFTAQD